MKIDWAALGLVAVVSFFAAVAIVSIFSLGVVALTSGGTGSEAPNPSAGAKIAGYACIGVSCLIAVYGLWLIIPQFH